MLICHLALAKQDSACGPLSHGLKSAQDARWDKGDEMAEGSHGDLLVAAATILGAILGVAGAYLVEYFRKERQSVRFSLTSPEDLARALRGSYRPKLVTAGIGKAAYRGGA